MGVRAYAVFAILALIVSPARAVLIVDDSFADGGRNNGADALDADWWTSASSQGIEVSPGSLGMVTGTAGRGIHATFPTQTLANIGDSITATYTFTTPATVGSAAAGGFRVGLFDTVGRAINADITASSGTPSPLYGYFGSSTTGLPGYMMDMDVGTGAEDLSFRQHDVPVTATTPTGRLLGTTTGFTSLGTGPDAVYTFAPNTTYTGSMTLTRTSATELTVGGSLGAATHSVIDATIDSASFGMLGFWANSNIFGTSATPGEANNGIDFTNVKIDVVVPEPGSAGMLGLIVATWITRRSCSSRRRA